MLLNLQFKKVSLETCTCPVENSRVFSVVLIKTFDATGGAAYSWFKTTGRDPVPWPGTATGGASGGIFPSNCSIYAPWSDMFCKINRQKKCYFSVLPCIPIV